MTASKIFLYFCLSFVGGIFLNSLIPIPQIYMLGILILGIFFISLFWRYKNFVIIGFCLFFLVFGIWRHQIFFLKIENSPIKSFVGKEVKLIGLVEKEPEIKGKSQKLIIKVEKINQKILVTTRRYPEYQYGEKLKINGKLEEPQIFEGFNYKNYLLKDGILATMNFPEIELIGKGFGNPVMKILFSFKNKFKEVVEKFIPPPQVGILEALTFGDETQISKEWKEKLNLTGTRHITAVSGMNITILCFLILSFILALDLWRQQAILLSLFLIFLYVLMIGASPSAIRAAIMGALVLFAQYFGRLSSGQRAVTLAAALMLFQNPLILKYDIGFQLSFLAILGLIYWQPIFFDLLKKIPNPEIFPVKSTLSATLSAQIFSLPILIYNFGNIPLFSPITNLLIVPFLAPLTIFIFIFGIFGMIFWLFGFILSLPTYFALTYILKLVDFFFKIPFSSLSFKISWSWLLFSYLILGLITRRLQESFTRPKFLR